MIRITVTKHDEARLEIIEYDILAWLSWPFDLLAVGYRKLSRIIKLRTRDSCVFTSLEWCKEYFVPSGGVRKPDSHRIVKCSMIPPCRRKWSYETRADYVSSAVDGIGSSMICRGKTERYQKNDK